MYWRLESLPELQHLPKEELERIIHNSVGKWFKFKMWCWGVSRGLLIALAVQVVAIYFFGLISTSTISLPTSQPQHVQIIYPNTFIFIVFPIAWLAATILLVQFDLKRIRRQVHRYLLEIKQTGGSIPVCLNCGYAIEDTAHHCPECGAIV